MPAGVEQFALFDARPKCPRCRLPYDTPTWEVLDDGKIIEVCSACARDYIGRCRQKPR